MIDRLKEHKYSFTALLLSPYVISSFWADPLSIKAMFEGLRGLPDVYILYAGILTFSKPIGHVITTWSDAKIRVFEYDKNVRGKGKDDGVFKTGG